MDIKYKNPQKRVITIEELTPGQVFKSLEDTTQVYLLIRREADGTFLVFDVKHNRHHSIGAGSYVIPYRAELVVYTGEDDVIKEGEKS